MSFNYHVIVRRTCLVVVGVLIGTSALAQRGGGQQAAAARQFHGHGHPWRGCCRHENRARQGRAPTDRRPGGDEGRQHAGEQHDGILRADLSDNVSTFIENSNQTNGMGWDLQGRLISVQRARGNEKVGVLYPPDKVATLADNYQGKPFDALNDMALDKRGGVYFTDTQGIYYLPPGGSTTRIIDEVPRPNGVVLSPDERTLYVHNKDGVYMLAFDVAPDGTISNRRNFARYKSVRIPGHKDPAWDEDNGADGMAVDSEGRVYAATNCGVEVFSPRGELLGVIPVQWGAENDNIRHPQNLAFGGPDRMTLYMVGAARSTRCEPCRRARNAPQSRDPERADLKRNRSRTYTRSASQPAVYTIESIGLPRGSGVGVKIPVQLAGGGMR